MAKGRRYPVRPPRPTGRRRAVELCKDVLILVLVCSALYLAGRSQPYLGLGEGIFSAASRLLGMDGGAGQPAVPGQPADTVRPVSLAFCTGVELSDGVRERCGVQYDTAAVDKAFDETVRRYLAQALAGAGAPQQVNRQTWEAALQAPGIYWDFLGHIPLDSLAAWLGEEGESPLTASARRLVLADRGADTAVLYYINDDDGLYYACSTPVTVQGAFTALLSERSANGARFVFEAGEDYAALSPDTLLLAETPSPPVYQGTSPVSLADTEGLNQLQSLLSFRPAGYETLDGWVNDTLRISQDGTVVYDARQTDDLRYPVAQAEGGGPDLTQACDTARALMESALSVGQTESPLRVCLLAVEQQGDGLWELRFGYTLSGALVEVQGSLTTGRFLVEEGRICAYELKLRQYQDTGEYTALLPEIQAAAAMGALDSAGMELALCYVDPGGEAQAVQAGWAAL